MFVLLPLRSADFDGLELRFALLLLGWAGFYGVDIKISLASLPFRRLHGGVVPPRAASKRGDASGRRQR